MRYRQRLVLLNPGGAQPDPDGAGPAPAPAPGAGGGWDEATGTWRADGGGQNTASPVDPDAAGPLSPAWLGRVYDGSADVQDHGREVVRGDAAQRIMADLVAYVPKSARALLADVRPGAAWSAVMHNLPGAPVWSGEVVQARTLDGAVFLNRSGT